MSEEDFDQLRRRAHPAIYFVVQFCGIQSPFSAFAAAIQPQRKAPRPAGAPISHRGPRSAFLSEDAPRGRPRSPALRGAKRRRRGIRGGARSPGPARPPPPGQQASGFKVKRGAALWLPGQRGGPGGRTDRTRGVISTHGNCGGGGCGGGGEKVKKSRLSEQSSGGEESSAVNRVRAEPTCFPSLSCFHSYNRLQQL